jgi:hypothetical protein
MRSRFKSRNSRGWGFVSIERVERDETKTGLEASYEIEGTMRRQMGQDRRDYRRHEAYRRTRSLLHAVCRAQGRPERRERGDEALAVLRRAVARAAVCLTGLSASLPRRCLERSLQVLDEAGQVLKGAAAEGRISVTEATALALTHRQARRAVSAALLSTSGLAPADLVSPTHPVRGIESTD